MRSTATLRTLGKSVAAALVAALAIAAGTASAAGEPSHAASRSLHQRVLAIQHHGLEPRDRYSGPLGADDHAGRNVHRAEPRAGAPP